MRALLWTLVFLNALPAMAAPEACEDGSQPWPWIGVDTLQCPGGGCAAYDFATEPRLRAIDPGGPAAGLLEEGDALVAVNGYLITSVRGGEELASLPLDRAAELTVRRAERLLRVSVVPEPRCGMLLTLSGQTRLSAGGNDSNIERVGGRGSVGLGIECDGCGFNPMHWQSWTGSPAYRRVVRVEPGGIADEAGLRVDDLLIAVDNLDLRGKAGNAWLFETLLGPHPDDRTLQLRYRRGGEVRETALRVPGRPGMDQALTINLHDEDFGLGVLRGLSRWWRRGGSKEARPMPRSITMSGESWGPGHLGMIFSWCEDCSWILQDGTVRWTLTEYPTVEQVEPGGPADLAGFRPGDVLTHVNGHDLKSEEAGKLLLNQTRVKHLTIRYQRKGKHEVAVLIPR